ncbi:hypothetical protein CSB67_1495 [Enterobacter hormaechei]|nr:hypothetical protein CSB67_1495 [Enterobacter hormaechei]
MWIVKIMKKKARALIINGGNVKRGSVFTLFSGNKKGTRGAFMVFINPCAL